MTIFPLNSAFLKNRSWQMPCGRELHEEEKFFIDPEEVQIQITVATKDVKACFQCKSIHGSNIFEFDGIKHINCTGIYIRLDKDFE